MGRRGHGGDEGARGVAAGARGRDGLDELKGGGILYAVAGNAGLVERSGVDVFLVMLGWSQKEDQWSAQEGVC